LLEELFSCENRDEVLCADGVSVKNLKIYEKNLVESKEIDYEPILKIYNFYSCVYLLNYIHTERTLKDQRIKIIAYLKSGETYVAKQASLITSIG